MACCSPRPRLYRLKLELLAELRTAPGEHEVRSELREDVVGLAVSTGTPGVFLWVFVSWWVCPFTSWLRRLGHADPSITLRVYAHVINEKLVEAAGIFARVIDEAT